MTAANRGEQGGRAVVAGGSIGGLCAALALREAGLGVTVYERAGSQLGNRGAGIVAHEESLRRLTGEGGLRLDDLSIPSRSLRYLDRAGDLVHQEDSGYRFTSWHTLHSALLALLGDGCFRWGVALREFTQDGQVEARFSDGSTERADLLACADGITSMARETLLPGTRPRYSGYIGWRGIVSAAEAGPALLEALGHDITYQLLDRGHILAYPIPAPRRADGTHPAGTPPAAAQAGPGGKDAARETGPARSAGAAPQVGSAGPAGPATQAGSAGPAGPATRAGTAGRATQAGPAGDGSPAGERYLNWVWYRNAAPGPGLNRLLTDTAGGVRDLSVPPGAVRPEVLAEMRSAAAAELDRTLCGLVLATREPFIQVVVDVEVPGMTFGRVCLLGDAAFVARPHAAAGTAKAAADAWRLGAAIRHHGGRGELVTALRDYERTQLPLGRALVRRARALGDAVQFDGSWRPGDPRLLFGLRQPGDSAFPS